MATADLRQTSSKRSGPLHPSLLESRVLPKRARQKDNCDVFTTRAARRRRVAAFGKVRCEFPVCHGERYTYLSALSDIVSTAVLSNQDELICRPACWKLASVVQCKIIQFADVDVITFESDYVRGQRQRKAHPVKAFLATQLIFVNFKMFLTRTVPAGPSGSQELFPSLRDVPSDQSISCQSLPLPLPPSPTH